MALWIALQSFKSLESLSKLTLPVWHMWKQILCGFSWAKRDITLAVWIRVFVYYMNKSYTCEQERLSVWTCVKVHTSVCEGGLERLQQAAPAQCAFKCLRQSCFQQKHCEFHPQDFLFYFWNLLLNSLQPHWFVWGVRMIVLACILWLCPFATQALCDHTSYGRSFSGFIDCCAEYLVRMFCLWVFNIAEGEIQAIRAMYWHHKAERRLKMFEWFESSHERDSLTAKFIWYSLLHIM